MTKEGRAYGFFDSPAEIDAIRAGLPEIQRMVESPSGLELSLDTMASFLGEEKTDPELVRFVGERMIHSMGPSHLKDKVGPSHPVPLRNLRYVIEARYDDTNEETAYALRDVLNGVLDADKPYNAAVVARADGEYQFLE